MSTQPDSLPVLWQDDVATQLQVNAPAPAETSNSPMFGDTMLPIVVESHDYPDAAEAAVPGVGAPASGDADAADGHAVA
eukprot:2495296-Pyramimonas_sp.AAC.1